MSLTIWCNLPLGPAVIDRLRAAVSPRRLVLAERRPAGNSPLGAPEPRLSEATIAFGQPEADQCVALPDLRWVHLSSAGYTTFDRPAVRAALGARGTAVTTSSAVFDEPCAQHALAFLLAEARQLPLAIGDRGWSTAPLRARSFLLRSQTIALVGFGSIARRLAALLGPFGCDVVGVRRTPRGDEPIAVWPLSRLDEALGRADHVVNILPANAETTRLFDARRFAAFRPGAVFCNIGRGTTVDQTALAAALESGHLRAAYLDVTDPEPLPPEHPLWAAPRCHITPHTAGGHQDEHERLVDHFAENLRRHLGGRALLDRVI